MQRFYLTEKICKSNNIFPRKFRYEICFALQILLINLRNGIFLSVIVFCSFGLRALVKHQEPTHAICIVHILSVANPLRQKGRSKLIKIKILKLKYLFVDISYLKKNFYLKLAITPPRGS